MANRDVRVEQNKKVFGNDEKLHHESQKNLNRNQNKKIFEQTFTEELEEKGKSKDLQIIENLPIRFSEKEYHSIRIKDKYPASEVANIVRFDNVKSYSDRLDLGMTPYLVLPIECIGKKGVYWLTCIAPTQSGKTAFLQVFVADSIDQSPGNMLYIMPTGKTALRGYADKILSMIEKTPELYEHVLYPKRDNLLKTITRLDNMSIYPCTSGSIPEISSITCVRIALDEVRSMGVSVGVESNVIKLAEDRLTVFLPEGLGQGASVSSPSIEGDLLHLQTTKPFTVVLHWYTECPECHKMQKLDFFKHMFTNHSKEQGNVLKTCHCLFCNAQFDDSDQKRHMNKTGKYGIDGLDGVHIDNFPEPILDRYVIFWWTSMNSPFRSFEDIYMAYISALVKYEDMINFLTCWLALFLKNEVTKFNVNILKERVSILPQGIVPDWTKVITCGIDTQDLRFYYVTEAWGSAHQSHILDYGAFESNIREETIESVHELLQVNFEDRIYLTEDGVQWALGLYAIDMGGHKTMTLHKATKGLKKIIKCFGRNKIDGIKYSNNDCYLANTEMYLEKTDLRPLSPNFTIFAGEHTEFFRQFLNIRQIEEVNKKTGKKTFQWVEYGQFDLRMAAVHSMIALNVGVGRKDNTFFAKLNQPNFIYNPIFPVLQKQIVEKKESIRDNQKINEYNKVVNSSKKIFTNSGYSM